MIETLTKETTYTVEEYFTLDQRSEEKLEYYNGKIIPMSGGTTTHSKISLRIGAVLLLLLDDQPYEVYSSDVKIQLPQYNRFVYADASVVSGKPEHYEGRRDTIVNPLLVVEVLSPSTEKHDRNSKFTMYRTLPSLQEYVLIEQGRPFVTTFFRNDAGHWEDTDVSTLDQSVRLRSVDSEVPLAQLYKNIDFDA